MIDGRMLLRICEGVRASLHEAFGDIARSLHSVVFLLAADRKQLIMISINCALNW